MVKGKHKGYKNPLFFDEKDPAAHARRVRLDPRNNGPFNDEHDYDSPHVVTKNKSTVKAPVAEPSVAKPSSKNKKEKKNESSKSK